MFSCVCIHFGWFNFSFFFLCNMKKKEKTPQRITKMLNYHLIEQSIIFKTKKIKKIKMKIQLPLSLIEGVNLMMMMMMMIIISVLYKKNVCISCMYVYA